MISGVVVLRASVKDIRILMDTVAVNLSVSLHAYFIALGGAPEEHELIPAVAILLSACPWTGIAVTKPTHYAATWDRIPPKLEDRIS